jgi:hypothetical protein
LFAYGPFNFLYNWYFLCAYTYTHVHTHTHTHPGILAALDKKLSETGTGSPHPRLMRAKRLSGGETPLKLTGNDHDSSYANSDHSSSWNDDLLPSNGPSKEDIADVFFTKDLMYNVSKSKTAGAYHSQYESTLISRVETDCNEFEKEIFGAEKSVSDVANVLGKGTEKLEYLHKCSKQLENTEKCVYCIHVNVPTYTRACDYVDIHNLHKCS